MGQCSKFRYQNLFIFYISVYIYFYFIFYVYAKGPMPKHLTTKLLCIIVLLCTGFLLFDDGDHTITFI